MDIDSVWYEFHCYGNLTSSNFSGVVEVVEYIVGKKYMGMNNSKISRTNMYLDAK